MLEDVVAVPAEIMRVRAEVRRVRDAGPTVPDEQVGNVLVQLTRLQDGEVIGEGQQAAIKHPVDCTRQGDAVLD